MNGLILNPYRFAAGAPSYQFLETFEGSNSGFDNTGWSKNNGSEDPDYTGVVLDATGSHCLRMTANNWWVEHSQTAQDTSYYYYLLRFSALAVEDIATLWIGDGSGRIGYVSVNKNNGKLFTLHGAQASGESTGVMAINTTYHILVRMTKATGAGNDGLMTAEFSTNGVFSGSGNNFVTMSNGTSQSQQTRIRLQCTGAYDVMVDRLIINNTPIGNNP